MDGAQWHLLKHTLTNNGSNPIGSSLQTELTELIPTLSSTDNWILLTYPLGAKNKSQPPLVESQRIARADGKCSRHKGWWREGKDELASHSTTTEVWTSTRSRISEATRITLQESLDDDDCFYYFQK